MKLVIKGLFALSALVTLTAQAEEQEYTAAVQERLYQQKHELTFWGGVVPDEDFTVNYPVSVGYRYHFNDHYAWEAVRASYFFSRARQLQDDLVEDYGIAPSDFDYPLYSAFSSFVVKPSYGKDSFFNRWVVNHETHFSIGGGLVGFLKEYNFGPNTEELAWSVRFAAGRKYYLNNNFAINLEIEEVYYFKEEGMTNNMGLNAGLSFQFSFKRRLAQESEELKLLYEYLGEQNEE